MTGRSVVGRVLAIVLLCALLVACDPAGAVIVQNDSDQPVVIRVLRGDPEATDVYVIAANERIAVGGNGVGGPPVVDVELLDADCERAYLQSFRSEPFPAGGVLSIGTGPSVTFEPGNPDTVPLGEPSETCG